MSRRRVLYIFFLHAHVDAFADVNGGAIRGHMRIFVFTKESVRSLERDGGERDEDGCRWLTPLARPSVTINTDVRVFPRTSH